MATGSLVAGMVNATPSLFSQPTLCCQPYLLYPTLWLSIAGLGMAFLLLPKGMPARWLGFICLAPLLLYQIPPLDKGSFQLSVLDVGQGSA